MESYKNIRIVFPLWQGGNNPSYHLGANLIDWLAPKSDMPTFHISVDEFKDPLSIENGMRGRETVKKHLDKVVAVLKTQNPDGITTLGGDCLVSLIPFAHLSAKYGDKLGVLWIDSHPDVQNSEQFSNAHAHVLGALLGHGDSDLTSYVDHVISPQKVMVAGVHNLLPHEAEFIDKTGVFTMSPEDVKTNSNQIGYWISSQKIEYLAIHIDLDVLDPKSFRSVLFAKPGRGLGDFGNVAEGKLIMNDLLSLVKEATKETKPVGLTIAEHLPWDAINLQDMLEKLPLMQ